jgi:hypothetical protein
MVKSAVTPSKEGTPRNLSADRRQPDEISELINHVLVLKVSLGSDLESARRALDGVPSSEVDELLMELLESYSRRAETFSKVRDLVILANERGKCGIFIEAMMEGRKDYSPICTLNAFSLLAAHNQTDCMKMLIEAAKPCGYSRELLFSEGTRWNASGSFKEAAALKAAVTTRSHDALELLITEVISTDNVVNVVRSLPDLLERAVANDDPRAIQLIGKLVCEASQKLDACDQHGMKIANFLDDMHAKCSRHAPGFRDWKTQGGLASILLAYYQDTNWPTWCPMSLAFATRKESSLEALRQLATENGAETYKVYRETLNSLEETSAHLHWLASRYKPPTSIFGRPRRDDSEGFLNGPEEATSTISFNRELYEMSLPLTLALDLAEENTGEGRIWAHKLASVFSTKQECEKYLTQFCSWAIKNPEDPNLWAMRDDVMGVYVCWPEGFLTRRFSSPIFTAAMDFQLPEGPFNRAGWAALMLESPETSKFLGQAVQIETFISRTDKTFPQDIHDFRSVLLEYSLSVLGLERHQVAGDLRNVLNSNEEPGSDNLALERSLITVPRRFGALLNFKTDHARAMAITNLLGLGVFKGSSLARWATGKEPNWVACSFDRSTEQWSRLVGPAFRSEAQPERSLADGEVWVRDVSIQTIMPRYVSRHVELLVKILEEGRVVYEISGEDSREKKQTISVRIENTDPTDLTLQKQFAIAEICDPQLKVTVKVGRQSFTTHGLHGPHFDTAVKSCQMILEGNSNASEMMPDLTIGKLQVSLRSDEITVDFRGIGDLMQTLSWLSRRIASAEGMLTETGGRPTIPLKRLTLKEN